MKYQYTHTCECGEEVLFDIDTGRPAPSCSNPSSPAYSDSGDPPEINGPEKCPACGKDLDLDVILERALDRQPQQDAEDCDYEEDR